MNVVYFAVGQEFAEQAELAAEALRLTNPGAEAWVITDQNTQFETLTPYRTHSSPHTLIYDRTLTQWRFLREHGSALFLDSDCVVNGPLDDVFAGPIAVTDRVPPRAVPHQIYNGGVLYGEGPQARKFWQDWADMYSQLERGAWAWWGDQMILPTLIEHHQVNVYPSATHNYIPVYYSECNTRIDTHIVHFKGKRKPWMPTYIDNLKAWYGA